VAGEAYSNESTSNNILIYLLRRILYPLDRHNILESSKTELRFSTQIASTGPSKVIQYYLSGKTYVPNLIKWEAIPSNQSLFRFSSP
jgi:hypothetical protein